MKVRDCQAAYQTEFEERPLGKGQTKYSKWSTIQSISWAGCLSRLSFHTQPEKNLGRFPSGWGRGEEEDASLPEQSTQHSLLFLSHTVSAGRGLQTRLAK